MADPADKKPSAVEVQSASQATPGVDPKAVPAAAVQATVPATPAPGPAPTPAPRPVPGAVPQINDAYWFSYSKNIVDGALKSRDDAADKLQTFVGWLWTVYTAGAAVGFALGKLSLSLLAAVLVSSPILALVIVYWMTVWVRVPILGQFDPQIPGQIEHLYNHNVLRKQWRLRLTLGAAAGSAILVAGAVFYAATTPVAPSAPAIKTVVHTVNDGKRLFVSGNLGDSKIVVVTVYSYANNQRGEILASETMTADKGFFRSGPITLNKTANSPVLVEVTATLNADGPTITATRILNLAACNTTICT